MRNSGKNHFSGRENSTMDRKSFHYYRRQFVMASAGGLGGTSFFSPYLLAIEICFIEHRIWLKWCPFSSMSGARGWPTAAAAAPGRSPRRLRSWRAACALTAGRARSRAAARSDRSVDKTKRCEVTALGVGKADPNIPTESAFNLNIWCTYSYNKQFFILSYLILI